MSPEAGGLAVGFADSFDGFAEEGDVVGSVLAEAGFGTEAEVVYPGGVDLHDLRAHGVGGDGVGAGDDDVGFDGGAGVLVALGADEAVDDGEPGAEDGGEVAEPLVQVAVHEVLFGEDGAHEVLEAEQWHLSLGRLTRQSASSTVRGRSTVWSERALGMVTSTCSSS